MNNDVTKLDSFDARIRRESLQVLARNQPDSPSSENVNLHMHSFFSFNAEGWSPSRVAWESRRAGLYAAGLCDFDVLDGVEEFLAAGNVLGLRTVAHLETRVFVREWRDAEITSPGEPGVTYIMGAGFVALPAAGSPAAAGLASYRRRARERNVALVQRINAQLAAVAVDYEREVTPLTPGGNATERHIIRAYVDKARAQFPDPAVRCGFWAKVLGRDTGATAALESDAPKFEEAVRARLVKRGGLAYEPPSSDTFPPIEEFVTWVRDCGAIPMITWLDGTSAAERDPNALLDLLIEKGCASINIIPDRNWNIADPDDRARKIANLRALVAASERRELPINIGTEMNRLGLPLVDNLDGPELRPHKEAFLRGARIMVGHSLLARYADFGYLNAAAMQEFATLAARNKFFEAVGSLPPTTEQQAMSLRDAGASKALAWFREQVRHA